MNLVATDAHGCHNSRLCDMIQTKAFPLRRSKEIWKSVRTFVIVLSENCPNEMGPTERATAPRFASSFYDVCYIVLDYTAPSDIAYRSGRFRQMVHTNPHKNTPLITYSVITYVWLYRALFCPLNANSSGYNILCGLF